MALALVTAPTRAGVEKQADSIAAFDAFWALYDENYALFSVKRADWDAVRSIYRPRVKRDTARADLFEIFGEAIDHLNDVHVSVRDRRTGALSRSGARSIGVGDFENGEFSLDLIASRYIDGGLTSRAGGAVVFGNLRGGAGYLRIHNFKHPTSTSQAIDEALARFTGERALVIDVRSNGGGLDSVGRLIANRFADRRRLYMLVSNRMSGFGRHDTAQATDWYVEPDTKPSFQWHVFVLTNSRTISAAENFILAMRVLPRVMVIGDVTAGAMADTVTATIDGEWAFTVPVNVVRDADGVCWEGLGLTPDLWVVNTPEGVASGRDRVLEFAQLLGPVVKAEPDFD